MDAQLFTIRHLLFLREQIAPFDVEFSSSDIDLDFTHMRDHMKRIMSGEASLFALSSSNAVVKMLGTGGPRVLHYRVSLYHKAVIYFHGLAFRPVCNLNTWSLVFDHKYPG